MKRRVLIGLGGAALLFVVALTRGAGPTAPPAPAPTSPMPERAPITEQADASPDPPPSTRNPFVYGGESSLLRGGAATSRPALDRPIAPPDPPVPEPVHFVGFVRRGGGLEAALSIEGQIEVVAAGHEALGYLILSVDEESGVQVRGPDGVERTIAPGP